MKFPAMNPATRWALLALAGVTVGASIAAVTLFDDDSGAQSVQLRDGDVIVNTSGVEETLDRASRSAGFRVVSPKSLDPIGKELRLDSIWVQPAPPPGPVGSPPRTFRMVTLTYKSGDQAIEVDQLNSAFDPTTSGERLPASTDDATIYFLETEGGVHYSMLSGGRGFNLTSAKPEVVDQDVAVKLLLAMAEWL